MSLKHPPMLALLWAALVANAGFFMLVPIFPVHVTSTLGFSAAAAGLVLAVRQFFQNVPTVVGGAIADRFGHRWTMVAGLVVRSMGFIGLGYAADLPSLVLAATLLALGGSFFDAASQAAVAQLVPPNQRMKAFAVLSLVFVLGSTIGPLAGVAAFQQGFDFVCLVAAVGLLLSACVVLAFVPATSPSIQAPAPVLESLAGALGDRAFVRFALLSSGLWYMGTLLYVAFPLHVAALTGGAEAAGPLFSLYAVMLLAFQVPLANLTARRMSPRARMASGLAASGIGFMSVGLMAGAPGLALSLAIIALGQMLTQPTFGEIVANLAPPRSLATYMGLGFLGLGIGGALANLTGGILFDVAVQLQALWLPWLIYGLVGLALAALFRRLTFGQRA